MKKNPKIPCSPAPTYYNSKTYLDSENSALLITPVLFDYRYFDNFAYRRCPSFYHRPVNQLTVNWDYRHRWINDSYPSWFRKYSKCELIEHYLNRQCSLSPSVP